LSTAVTVEDTEIALLMKPLVGPVTVLVVTVGG